MRMITEAKRNDIIAKLTRKESSRKIAKETGVSRTYIDKLRNTVFPHLEKAKGGRPAKLSDAAKRFCVRQATVGGINSAVRIASPLERVIEDTVSPDTVRRALKEFGLEAVEKQKKPAIDERTRKARLQFAKKYKHYSVYDWRRVIWSDETKINRFCSDGRTWAWVRDSDVIQPQQVKSTSKHGGGSIMIWSAITAAGTGWLCKIDGTIDSQLYLQFLKDELELTLDYAAKTLSLRKEQLVFQHDNDPKHTAKAVREYLNEQNYEVLEWPAHSPDLSPIEHMWALFKRKLNEYESPPKGVQELYERVVDIWYNQITREDRLKVIDSMPDRIQAVIKAKGYWTKY